MTTEESYYKEANAPTSHINHPTLKSVLCSAIEEYVPYQDVKLFVIDNIIEYSVGIDLYEFITEPMCQQYKFNHWSGEEIYPDEEQDYLEQAKTLECYYFNNIQNMKKEKKDLKVIINRKDEWKVSVGCNLWRPENEIHSKNIKELQATIIMEINKFFNDLFGCKFDFDFGFNNNFGATTKYGIIHAHSKSVKLYDRDNDDMYITLYGSCNINAKRSGWYDLFEPEQLIFNIKAVVYSNQYYCSIDMPFYM